VHCRLFAANAEWICCTIGLPRHHARRAIRRFARSLPSAHVPILPVMSNEEFQALEACAGDEEANGSVFCNALTEGPFTSKINFQFYYQIQFSTKINYGVHLLRQLAKINFQILLSSPKTALESIFDCNFQFGKHSHDLILIESGSRHSIQASLHPNPSALSATHPIRPWLATSTRPALPAPQCRMMIRRTI